VLIRILQQRNIDTECRTFPRLAFDGDAPIMQFNERTGDCQTESCAAGFAGCAVACAVEAVENMVLFFGRHADAGILDGDAEPGWFCRQRIVISPFGGVYLIALERRLVRI
jgi:hypothetical protein